VWLDGTMGAPFKRLPESYRLGVSGDRVWKSKYPAVRSRVFYWVLTSPILVLYAAMVIAVDTTGNSVSAAWKIVFVLPLLFILAIGVRTIFGWDVVVEENQLIYRSAFRNLRVPRSDIVAVTVDEGRSAARLQNLMVVNLHMRDSTQVPLKLFNSFRPRPDAPNPLGFQRLNQMASELNSYIKTSGTVDR
jgi:hypothetical protein